MEVCHASLTIGGLVQEGVTEIDTNFSDKSVFRCNNNIGQCFVAALQGKGVQINTATSGNDLGIEASAGKRRCAATQNQRIAKGRKRSARNGQLAKINSQAHMLGPTGTQPQQAYGHVAQGASPIQVNNMRRNTKLGTTMGGTK